MGKKYELSNDIFPQGEFIFEPLPEEIQLALDHTIMIPDLARSALIQKGLAILNERRDYLFPNWREL